MYTYSSVHLDLFSHATLFANPKLRTRTFHYKYVRNTSKVPLFTVQTYYDNTVNETRMYICDQSSAKYLNCHWHQVLARICIFTRVTSFCHVLCFSHLKLDCDKLRQIKGDFFGIIPLLAIYCSIERALHDSVY